MARSGKGAGKNSRLRIIGGQWRGRRLSFTPAEGLRPTTDRVRETLFNWVALQLPGARCADLFAGSGALGLEALSRGASHCDFVDTSDRALTQIHQHLLLLGADAAGCCHTTSALHFLQTASQKYDLVFIDPPFGGALVQPVCALLAENDLLAQGALVYVETALHDPPPDTPPGWSLHRDKAAGGVAYRLFTVD